MLYLQKLERVLAAKPVSTFAERALVCGQRSDLLDETITAKMRKAAPQMDFVEAAGIGHAPMLTEPGPKAAILEFLARAA